jgi:hypothetical protein
MLEQWMHWQTTAGDNFHDSTRSNATEQAFITAGSLALVEQDY